MYGGESGHQYEYNVAVLKVYIQLVHSVLGGLGSGLSIVHVVM